MNGEVAFVSRLTAAARNALKGGEFIFALSPQEQELSFVFCERKKLMRTEPEYTVRSAEAWFDRIKSDGATDIFMMLPYQVKDMGKLGFINTSGATIFVRTATGQVTRFLPQWIFDNINKRWSIIVHEDLMEDAPTSLPVFKDNTEQFKAVLTNIAKFAQHIEEKQFFECFMMGAGVLSMDELPNTYNREFAPALSEKGMKLYLAADISDVFGAMGSWNDSPKSKAAEMGLSEDYDKLSAALLAQNRLAVMYAVNED